MIEETREAGTNTEDLAGKRYPIGKYKGRTYANIALVDPHYVIYVKRSLRTNAERYANLDPEDTTSGDAIFYKAGKELLQYTLSTHLWDHLLEDSKDDNPGLDSNTNNNWSNKSKITFNRYPTKRELEPQTPAPKRKPDIPGVTFIE